MSDLLTTLNKVASDKRTDGKHDARLALAALVLIDKDNRVVLDGDSVKGLADSIKGVVRTAKFTVTLQQLAQVGAVTGEQFIDIGDLEPDTVILFAQVKHSDPLVAPMLVAAEANPYVHDPFTPADIVLVPQPLDVAQAVDPNTFSSSPGNALVPSAGLFGIVGKLQLRVMLTGANFADLTAGQIDFWITYYIRP